MSMTASSSRHPWTLLRSPLLLLLLLLLFLLTTTSQGLGRRGSSQSLILDAELKCSACQQTVHAIEAELANVDEKATIKIGHRLQSGTRPTDGGGKHISYARSEIHIAEVLDSVCEPLEKYDAIQSNEDGSRVFVQVNNRPKGSEKSSLQMRGGEGRALADVCYDMIEQHEDEISLVLRTQEELIETALAKKICHEIAGLCDQGGNTQKKKKKKIKKSKSNASVEEEPSSSKAEL